MILARDTSTYRTPQFREVYCSFGSGEFFGVRTEQRTSFRFPHFGIKASCIATGSTFFVFLGTFKTLAKAAGAAFVKNPALSLRAPGYVSSGPGESHAGDKRRSFIGQSLAIDEDGGRCDWRSCCFPARPTRFPARLKKIPCSDR